MRLTSATVQVSRALLSPTEPVQWLHDISLRAGYPTGVVYPILKRMRDEGWLTDQLIPDGRRLYQITDDGRRELADLLERAKRDPRFSRLFPS